MTKVNRVRIADKIGASESVDLIGSQVQCTFGTPATFNAHVKSGKVRPVAVAGVEPSALFPATPTISSSGVHGYESVVITGKFATARMPEPVINRLDAEIVRHLDTREAKQRFLKTGVEAGGRTPAAFAVAIKVSLGQVRQTHQRSRHTRRLMVSVLKSVFYWH